jgi:phospholipid-binding lipoprotein MlaA
VPEGPYLVIPLLGPSTLRDFPTQVIEPIINPFGDSGGIFDSASSEWMVTFYLSEFFVLSSEVLPQYELMKSASLDPYISVRTAYYQLR